MNIPGKLLDALRPITIVAGHYGAGKTNFSVNLAVDLAKNGKDVTVIDLDIVNPYFRATEQRGLLESYGVQLVAPVFAEAGTSLDVPSLTGRIVPALQDAVDGSIVIVDSGGDDVGATALGRFSMHVRERDYAFLYVANRFRNLVQDPDDAIANLREIEQACHLQATAIANNSHLKASTTAADIVKGEAYAREVAKRAGLPLVCTTVPPNFNDFDIDELYPVQSFVKNPWE